MVLEHDLQVAARGHFHQLPAISKAAVHIVVVSSNLKTNRVTKPLLRYGLLVHVLAWKLGLSTKANGLRAAGVDCPVPMDSGARGAGDTQTLFVVKMEQVEHKRVFVHVRRACSGAIEHLVQFVTGDPIELSWWWCFVGVFFVGLVGQRRRHFGLRHLQIQDSETSVRYIIYTGIATVGSSGHSFKQSLTKVMAKRA